MSVEVIAGTLAGTVLGALLNHLNARFRDKREREWQIYSRTDERFLSLARMLCAVERHYRRLELAAPDFDDLEASTEPSELHEVEILVANFAPNMLPELNELRKQIDTFFSTVVDQQMAESQPMPKDSTVADIIKPGMEVRLAAQGIRRRCRVLLARAADLRREAEQQVKK